MLSVELHTHSAASYDGRDPIERILATAAEVGLDAIAITDHDTIEASLEAVDIAPEYGLIGIPGIEVSSAAGHVLAIGVRERIQPGLPFLETVDRIHDHDGLAIIPHPFQGSRSGVAATVDEEMLTVADAIEVYNSRLLTGRANRRARIFAQEHGLPMTAGSDAHIAEMVGRAVTKLPLDPPASVEEILAEIRAGNTTVEGTRTPWRISFRQAAGGAKRRMRTRLKNLLE